MRLPCFTAPGTGLTTAGFNGGLYNGYVVGTGSPASGLDVTYQDILTGGLCTTQYPANPCTVTLNNLTSGQEYEVQMWVDDSRAAGESEIESVADTNSNNTLLLYNVNSAVGGLGQYAIGTFTADGTNEVFTMDGNLSTLINAIQLRDLSVCTTPAFSPPAGTYLLAQTVTITSESGSTVFYTTNGTTPTVSSFSGPVGGGSATITIPAPATVTINAIATNNNEAPSAIATAVYVTGTAPPPPHGVITWTGPFDITGDMDVTNSGASVFAYDYYGVSKTVNGVNFTAPGTGLTTAGFNGGLFNGYLVGTGSPANGLDVAYQDVLTGGLCTTQYPTSPCTVTLNNLAAGQEYEVQMWVDDSRQSGETEQLADGNGNTITLDYNVNGSPGGLGQYAIGTFYAAGSNQVITMDGNLSTLINAIQLRDLSVCTTPAFSPPAGTYLLAQTVTITSESGSTVFYTTNGTTPTVSSFSGPVGGESATITIPAPATVTINAIATNNNEAPSAIATAVYVTGTAPPPPRGVITWTGPFDITGDMDVTNNGSPVFAYDYYETAEIVNGVNFTAPGNGITTTNFNGGLFNGYLVGTGSPANGLDVAYQDVLTGGLCTTQYPTSPCTVTLNNLAAGQEYEVQMWVDDSRLSGEMEQLADGNGNVITLGYNVNESPGGLGQYAIGTFYAAGSNQVITMDGNLSTLINAIQLRDLSTLSAPVLSSFGPLTGGQFPLTFSGPNGQSYRVLTTTNLSLPPATWTQLTNGVFGANAATYTVTTATNLAQFFRIVSP